MSISRTRPPFAASVLIMAISMSALQSALVFSEGTAPASQGIPVRLGRGGGGPYRLIERSDWSRYDDGKYLGHVYREVRATIAPAAASRGNAGATEFRGDFIVLEETLRDLAASARAVDEVIPSAFRIRYDGTVDMIEDRGFPSLRGFPAFPSEPVTIGRRWTARGVRAVDPRNEGKPVLIPLIAEYEYRGVEQYKNVSVHRIFAKYATRYKSMGNPSTAAGMTLTSATGTHEVDILIRAEDGLPLLIRDRLDETFAWADGSTTRFKGFTLTFSEGISRMDRDAVAAELRGALAEKPSAGTKVADASGVRTDTAASPERTETRTRPSEPSTEDDPTLRTGTEAIIADGDFDLAPGANGIVVSEVDAGIKLTIPDVRFKPDSDEVLPSEKGRLDLIADALKKTGDRTVLVEGHTAAVGKAAGELELSTRRAKRIVDELAARGIAADRFLYKGWGGQKPLAGNDTEPGRAKNRRVEITILE